MTGGLGSVILYAVCAIQLSFKGYALVQIIPGLAADLLKVMGD